MRRAIWAAVACTTVFTVAIILSSGDHISPDGIGPIRAITTILTAQVQYYSSYSRYAASLGELGPPTSGAEGPSAAGLIDRDLAGGEKGGYRFTLLPLPAGYKIVARPLHPGATSRSYLSGAGMKIHLHVGEGPPTDEDPVLGE